MLGACARPPEPFICPEIGLGDLTVTEIRGGDVRGSAGHWIELYNGSGGAVDMHGLQLRLQRTTGGNLTRIIIRTQDLIVEAGDYVVLGHHEPGEVPDFVDYSFFSDFFAEEDDAPTPVGPEQIFETGVIDVLACGETVDHVVYPRLPEDGTWSFNGDLDPDEAMNDIEINWCTDDFDPGGPQTETGLPGTPGEANRPCVAEPPP